MLRGVKMNKIYLKNGNYLVYGQGKFDKWCVFEVNQNGKRKAPKDINYFNNLYEFAKIFGSDKIYTDFVKIYDMTTKYFENYVIEEIENISLKYEDYKDDIFNNFLILYMAMISEQNKKNTVLGKRIKRLGLYYLLVKGQPLEYCVNFMTGKNCRELDKLCREGGF